MGQRLETSLPTVYESEGESDVTHPGSRVSARRSKRQILYGSKIASHAANALGSA